MPSHVAEPGLLPLSLAYRSETGQRSRNEDALRVAQIGPVCHFIVSDGAGGHQRGEEASRRVVDHLDARLAEHAQTGASPDADVLAAAICSAHDELRQLQTDQHASRRMHATVVALWLDRETREAVWSHVGDSRLYRLRHGRLDHVSEDDSVVQHMVRAGWLSAEQARSHPNKNQLVAALGMAEQVQPHTRRDQVEDGDAYLLCTDGWWDPLDARVLEDSLAGSLTPQAWLAALLEHIGAHAPTRQDNHSAIAVWIGQPGEVTRPPYPSPLSR
jgi:serine/threonine protein phosphatase PrpC